MNHSVKIPNTGIERVVPATIWLMSTFSAGTILGFKCV
jgi:hypothetical protein